MLLGFVKSIVKKAIYTAQMSVSGSPIPRSPQPLYSIKAGYRHRLDNQFYEAAATSGEEWQREVYQTAAEEADRLQAKTVYDMGCGSGRKLMKHFAQMKTVGFDLPDNVEHLRKTYPAFEWRISDFNSVPSEPADVVICADVVEHISDPDELMNFLSRLNFKKLFLSTPERRLVYGFNHSGPPRNQAHCREWTMAEFRNYVERWFSIERHHISNKKQATQLAVCVRPTEPAQPH